MRVKRQHKCQNKLIFLYSASCVYHLRSIKTNSRASLMMQKCEKWTQSPRKHHLFVSADLLCVELRKRNKTPRIKYRFWRFSFTKYAPRNLSAWRIFHKTVGKKIVSSIQSEFRWWIGVKCNLRERTICGCECLLAQVGNNCCWLCVERVYLLRHCWPNESNSVSLMSPENWIFGSKLLSGDERKLKINLLALAMD